MQLSPDYTNNITIQSYQLDNMVINEKKYHGNVIISIDNIQDWSIDLNNLHKKDFDLIVVKKPEIFILGAGEKRINIHAEFLTPLFQAGIGVEIMDTGSACRTFNILSAENRNVIAGLILRR